MQRAFPLCLIAILTATNAYAAAEAEAFKQLSGRWRITELTDDGSVMSPEQIKHLLPSGGRVELVDNTIQFTSRLDGSKQAKTFNLDATVYPSRMIIASQGKNEGWGIYRFDGPRLIVCMSNPAVAPSPVDFSAPKGSNRMLMVLERDNGAPTQRTITPVAGTPRLITPPPTTLPPISQANNQLQALPAQPNPPAAPSTTAARVLTDAQVAAALRGRWQFNDGAGLVNVTLEPDGTFYSTRRVQNASTFTAVFTTTPVSNGTWSVNQGQLLLHVKASIYANRDNRVVPLAVRSVSATDLLFVDSIGRLGRAVRLP